MLFEQLQELAMRIAGAAPIIVLIALSGCTQKVEASDPPAVAEAAAPIEHPEADDLPAFSGESDGEPRMQSPVEYD